MIGGTNQHPHLDPAFDVGSLQKDPVATGPHAGTFDVYGWLCGIEINVPALPHDKAVAMLHNLADAANTIFAANPYIRGKKLDMVYGLTDQDFCPALIDLRGGGPLVEIEPAKTEQPANGQTNGENNDQ